MLPSLLVTSSLSEHLLESGLSFEQFGDDLVTLSDGVDWTPKIVTSGSQRPAIQGSTTISNLERERKKKSLSKDLPLLPISNSYITIGEEGRKAWNEANKLVSLHSNMTYPTPSSAKPGG